MAPFVTLVTTSMRLRTVAVWLAVTGATGGVGLLVAPALLSGPGRTFVDVLTWGCAAGGLVAAAATWGVVTDVARGVLVGTLPSRRTVGPLRMLVLLACGLAALGSPAAAQAPAGHQSPGSTTESARNAEAEERRTLSGLPLPDRPGTNGTRRAPRPGPPHRGVTVRSGDHLWGLARDQLGPDVSEAAIARHVAELHRHNVDVIGPDPDVILPGQHLALPPPPGRDHS